MTQRGKPKTFYVDTITLETLRLLGEEFRCSDNLSETLRRLCAAVRAQWKKEGE